MERYFSHFTLHIKINTESFIDLKLKSKIYKAPEENIIEIFHGLGVGKLSQDKKRMNH